MKLALYGGSFNPPPLGHVHAVRSVLDTLQPDRFLVIPDYLPPHKELSLGSPSPEERLKLCRIAFRQFSSVTVSDLEYHRAGKSYTADTISSLRSLYPTDSFFLVIGTDMLLCFRQWYHYEYLLSECTLAVLARADSEDQTIRNAAADLIEHDHARITLIPCKVFPANSTEIRALLAKGEHPDTLDEAVYRCILKNNYYKKTGTA